MRVAIAAVALLLLAPAPEGLSQTRAWLWSGADWYNPGGYVHPIYRYYNVFSGDHLLTANPAAESPYLGNYVYEGIPFMLSSSPGTSLRPLYRFLKPNGSHFYATSPWAGRGYYQPEGAIGFIALRPQWGLTPLYVWYNPYLDLHFYTTSPQGELGLIAGYQFVGIVGYVRPFII